MKTALSVVSWNLHGVPFITTRETRFGRVAARLLEMSPDVVLFQEVWLRRDAGQLIRHLDASYDPVPLPVGRLPRHVRAAPEPLLVRVLPAAATARRAPSAP